MGMMKELDQRKQSQNVTGTVSETASADEELLSKMPMLQRYINRVGAEVRSFRRFVVRGRDDVGDDDGYNRTRELGVIKIATDGKISWSGEVEPPSELEVAVIAQEVAAAKWPTSTAFLKGERPDTLVGVTAEDIFEFLTEGGKHGTFLQQRRWNEAGKKFDVPWSFWSDGKWRQMEPDGLLPLYGLQQLKRGGTIYVHEGAKTAQYLLRAMEDKDWSHPWAEQLRNSVHIGWPGGAPNPHRVDWTPLKRLGRDEKVVIVADKDNPGIDAVSKISSMLRRPLEVILFDGRFPPGFDLSDEWPERLWQDGNYIGPTMADLTFPATWATDAIPNPSRKGPTRYQLRREFSAEWVWVETPHEYINLKQPNRRRSADEFSRSVRPFSDVKNIAPMLEQVLASKADSTCYRPRRADAHESSIITEDNRRLCNVFKPSSIRPKAGNAAAWEEFLRHLIPDEGDRHELKRWIATFVARPDVRIRYGVLLVSERQGVGKTTLCNILSDLAGKENVSWPNEKTIVDSSFNSWIAYKRLAIVSEIYSGQSRKAYDNLKAATADDRIEVNEKFKPRYEVENVVHLLACSNSKQAIHIDHGDRRWLVPLVTEQQHPRGERFWVEFNAWLKGGGLSIIAHWADQFLRDDPKALISTGAHAPDTAAKREVIAESMSPGQQLSYDLAQLVAEMAPEKKVVLIVREVRNWVARWRGMDMNDSRLEKPATIRKAMRAAGLKERQYKKGEEPRMKVGKTYEHVVANFDIPPEETWAKLKGYIKPDDLMPIPEPGM